VDLVRARLLSPESKVSSSISIRDVDTNPAFGKGTQLAREISYLPRGSFKNLVVSMYLQNFTDAGNLIEIAGIPQPLGGLGLDLSVEFAYSLIPIGLKPYLAYVANANMSDIKQVGCQKVLRALRDFSSMYTSDRGSPVDLEDLEDPLREVLMENLPTVTIRQAWEITYGEGQDLPAQPRFFDMKRRVESRGFIDISRIPLTASKPFWHQSSDRQFVNLTIAERLKVLHKRIPPPNEDLTLDGFRYLTLLEPHDFVKNPVYVHRDHLVIADMTEFGTVTGVDLNILGKSTGKSLRMGIPNESILFR
jgi:hypothetical protein